jgi:hypothetical protein
VTKNTLGYNYVSKCQDQVSRGGGVAISVDRILSFLDLSHLLPANLSESLEMIFVQIVHGWFELCALNV